VNQRELDDAVAQILLEQVDEKLVRDSARRVFRQVFDSTYIAGETVEKIKGCRDVQLLIPSYVSGTLSRSRAMLVEDHVLGCADCRRVLHPRRDPSQVVENRRPRNLRRPSRVLVWGLAASLVIGIALGVTAARRGILPWQHTLEATVESVEGSLYRVSDVGATLIEVGSIVSNADELRTAKGSRAILRLAGGAKLELAERSDVTVDAAWHGTDVNLERGRMIVQASGASQQTFYVLSGDMVIPDHGTVLALDHGTKGSRVAVAKGSAQLERGRFRNTLFAGQQFVSSYAVYKVPIASEFAWSQNADQYLALLNEFSALQKSLQSIPSPGLRYSPTLAQYLPASTIVYAAIPNLGATLTQAKQMFDSRLAESEVLRNWWQQQPIAQNGEFDRLVNQVSSISSYLGDEIVLALTSNGGAQQSQPVFLAEIRQPGLADYIKNNLPSDSGVHIVGSADASTGNKGELFVEVDHNLLIASPSLATVQQVETLVQAPSSSQFTGTPLFARVKEVYSNGADYFLAADLEQIIRKSVSTAKGPVPPGLDNAHFLVLERKDISGTTEMRAALSFEGVRQGIASWLASPGPVGSLDFVSPDASAALSIVMKNPRAMMQELISYGSNADGSFAQHLSEFESQAGVSLLDDVAAPLGSDATFAIDGPGLPTSAWKLAIEVYDPDRLQQTLATFADRFNQQASAGAGTLQLTSHPAGGLDIHSISSSKWPALSVSYTFVDGYLLAAGSEGNLVTAIRNKRAGQTLATSSGFRAKLPADGYTNFSAMFYQNIGNTLGPLANQMKNSSALTPQQRQSLSALIAGRGPGLICLYGEPDRIIAASTGSFLGFDLGTLAGIYQGKPVVPLITANASLFRSKAMKPN
jgi:FecR protein/Putative zinc-finger